jgi:hypothetical protein
VGAETDAGVRAAGWVAAPVAGRPEVGAVAARGLEVTAVPGDACAVRAGLAVLVAPLTPGDGLFGAEDGSAPTPAKMSGVVRDPPGDPTVGAPGRAAAGALRRRTPGIRVGD